MTNFEKWQYVFKDIRSPQSYIDFGYYSLIAAALQRRVWTGPKHMPLYPNMYIIFVGDPGIGKGLVIKQVAQFLKHHKLKKKDEQPTNVKPVDSEMMEALAMANQGNAGIDPFGFKNIVQDDPLLFPVAAEATTFEALTKSIAKATRYIGYKEFCEQKQKDLNKIYTHASISFCLEELSSLFRKKADAIVDFLIVGYDCGDYKYETKHQGVDNIKNCFVNFLGATQPSFVQSSFSDRLLTEGYASRTIFIFEYENRHNNLFIPHLDEQQVACRESILLHIKALSKLYGHVQLTNEAREYLKEWWRHECEEERPNESWKLQYYYARKDIHVQKMAIAIHFGESSTSMEITKPDCECAVKMLAGVEQKMHYALSFDKNNPLSQTSKKIMKSLYRRPMTHKELLAEHWDDVRDAELQEILGYLSATKKIKQEQGPGINGHTVIKYKSIGRRI